jgi:cellulose synthase/poly-beta-1,6-N-acetylglucosamine synthase-like glycosyltransferase
MYNERAVFERCIVAATCVRWPKEKLQIMVIDDSDQADISQDIDSLCRRLRGEGHPVLVYRRPDRVGYKGGALAFAMKYTQGEFVAMFDTDFVVTPDFLERTVPHFYDADGNKNSVGLVQCPWTWLNGADNMLTRAQVLPNGSCPHSH